MQKLLDIGEMQAGRGLVEDIDSALLRHLDRELEPLPLSAGERRQRLAEADIPEADLNHPVQDKVRRARTKKLLRLSGRHREYLGDVLAVEAIFEDLRLETLAAALLAHGRDVGHHRQVGIDD